MRLEDAFLNDLASGFRIDIYGVGEDLEGEKQVTRPPAQEMAVAADDFTQMGTEMAAGTEPPGATPMTLGEFATSAADVPAGLLKGAVQETIGLPGDIESLGKAVGRAVPGLAPSQATLFPVVNAIRTLKNIPGGALDRFLEGLEEETILPTSEDIKRFFDETLGIPLVPAGASERRREAAKIPEFVGELGAMGELATRATKGAARAAGQIGREIATTPPTGALRSATPEQPKYFTQIPETSKEIDRITEYLERQSKDSGFQVKTGASNISGSRYVTVTKQLPDDEVYSVQIRISNHGDKSPGSLGVANERFSIDPETGNTLQDALEFLKDQGFDLRKTKKRNKKLSEKELAKKYGILDEQFLKSFRESRQSREQK